MNKIGFALMIDKNSLDEITSKLNTHIGQWSSQEVNDLLTNYIDLNRITYNSKLEHKDVVKQEMLEYPKIKFLNDPDEKERMRQTVQEIIESFNSDLLGFVETEKHTFFFKGSPMKELEDLCILYDIDELTQLDEIKKLKDFLQKNVTDAYPNVKLLIDTLNKH